MRCVLLAGCLLGTALSHVMATPFPDGAYTEYWGRADALLPGMTRIAEDLAVAGEWEIVGGRRVESAGAGGIAAVAKGETVAFVWKGGVAREYPLLTVNLALDAQTPVPARVMFHLFSDGGFRAPKGGIPANLMQDRTLTFQIPLSRGGRQQEGLAPGLIDGFKL